MSVLKVKNSSGTWVQIKDKFVIAVGDSHTAGTSYGSNTKDFSHTHTTGNHTLTIEEIPSHNHYVGSRNPSSTVAASGTNIGAEFLGYDVYSTFYTANTGGSGSHNHGNTGSSLSSTLDITPACEAAYCWKRTA